MWTRRLGVLPPDRGARRRPSGTGGPTSRSSEGLSVRGRATPRSSGRQTPPWLPPDSAPAPTPRVQAGANNYSTRRSGDRARRRRRTRGDAAPRCCRPSLLPPTKRSGCSSSGTGCGPPLRRMRFQGRRSSRRIDLSRLPAGRGSDRLGMQEAPRTISVRGAFVFRLAWRACRVVTRAARQRGHVHMGCSHGVIYGLLAGSDYRYSR